MSKDDGLNVEKVCDEEWLKLITRSKYLKSKTKVGKKVSVYRLVGKR